MMKYLANVGQATRIMLEIPTAIVLWFVACFVMILAMTVFSKLLVYMFTGMI